MLAGSSGWTPMPRKMAGSEMMTTDELNRARNVPMVVFDSTTHR